MKTPGSWIPNGWLEWSLPPTMLSPRGPPAFTRWISLREEEAKSKEIRDITKEAQTLKNMQSRMFCMSEHKVSTHRTRGFPITSQCPENTVGQSSSDYQFFKWKPPKITLSHIATDRLTSMGYWSSRPLDRWFLCSEGVSSGGLSPWLGGGGGECMRTRGTPGESPSLSCSAPSLSTSSTMVGEDAVSSATAWSCLASVMSTPLI